MKVIFTCGGTAGHVNPALALAGLMKRRMPDTEILFVGANRGMERRLVEQAGGQVVARMAVLAEGAAAKRDDIIVLEALPLFHPDGTPMES